MRGPPKALLRVPDPDRGQLRSTRPFDDLLIKTDIEMGLVMIVPSKVYPYWTSGAQAKTCQYRVNFMVF